MRKLLQSCLKIMEATLKWDFTASKSLISFTWRNYKSEDSKLSFGEKWKDVFLKDMGMFVFLTNVCL